MAEGGACTGGVDGPDWNNSQDNLQEQQDEVMALESIFCETDNLRVTTRPGEEQKGLFHLEVDIEVGLKEDGILVQTWIPYESDKRSPEKSTAKVAPSLRPDFKRSESGKRWHSTFVLTHLKPLTLSVHLSQSYPSDGPPDFNLSAVWLDAGQLSVLCQKLDHIWSESLGMPVIYNWIDFLQNDTLRVLCIEDSVVLTPYEPDDVTYDPRALPECHTVEDDLINLSMYAEKRQLEEFLKSEHTCGVCFMEYPGSQFHRLEECRHHFCHECMMEYCSMHVKEGTVQFLRCPDQDCKFHVSPAILRDVLGDEAYMRWERLSLKKALETMEDVEWCPRCSSAVISDSDGNQAYCTNCCYSFCPRCYEPFHSKTSCTSAEEQVEKLEQEIKKVSQSLGLGESELREIATDSDIPIGSMDDLSRRKLLQLQSEYLSKQFIKKKAKNCPSCKIPIEKIAGCNKVTCLQCRKCMCWVCGKAISGYDHFSQDKARCALFPGVLPDIAERFDYARNRPVHEGAVMVNEALMAGRMEQIMRCPRCNLRNIRNGRNNHIKCWSCKSNICFQCKSCITGLVNSHFTAAKPCNQHGDL